MSPADDDVELTPLTDDDLEKGREAVEPAGSSLLVGTSARTLNRARDIVRSGLSHFRIATRTTRDVVERFAVGVYTLVCVGLVVVLLSAASGRPSMTLLIGLPIVLVTPIVLYTVLWHRQRLNELTGNGYRVDLAKLRLHEHETHR